jgi:ATP synthase protein I
MNDPDKGRRTGPIGEDRRLDSLDERLGRLEASEAERMGSGKPASADAGYRLGNRVLADLIGGIAGGALIGWLIDRVAGTWPWGFMIFLFLGIIVAFRNIFRIANQASRNRDTSGEG